MMKLVSSASTSSNLRLKFIDPSQFSLLLLATLLQFMMEVVGFAFLLCQLSSERRNFPGVLLMLFFGIPINVNQASTTRQCDQTDQDKAGAQYRQPKNQGTGAGLLPLLGPKFRSKLGNVSRPGSQLLPCGIELLLALRKTIG